MTNHINPNLFVDFGKKVIRESISLIRPGFGCYVYVELCATKTTPHGLNDMQMWGQYF